LFYKQLQVGVTKCSSLQFNFRVGGLLKSAPNSKLFIKQLFLFHLWD